MTGTPVHHATGGRRASAARSAKRTFPQDRRRHISAAAISHARRSSPEENSAIRPPRIRRYLRPAVNSSRAGRTEVQEEDITREPAPAQKRIPPRNPAIRETSSWRLDRPDLPDAAGEVHPASVAREPVVDHLPALTNPEETHRFTASHARKLHHAQTTSTRSKPARRRSASLKSAVNGTRTPSRLIAFRSIASCAYPFSRFRP